MNGPSTNDSSAAPKTTRAATLHIVCVLSLVFACTIGIGTANWILDPFHHLLTESREARRDARAVGDWPLKVALERMAPYNALVIGTSKMEYVNPADLNYFHFYNAGVGAARIEDIREFLDVSTRDLPKIKLVVLGLDFFMFNGGIFFRSPPPPSFDDEANYLLAPDSGTRWLKANFEDLTNSFSYLLSFKGLRRAALDRHILACLGNGGVGTVLQAGNLNVRDLVREAQLDRLNGREVDRSVYKQQISDFASTWYVAFSLSNGPKKLLSDIKAMLAQRGVRLIVLINPVNSQELAEIKDLGLEGDFNQYRADVRAIFPDAHDFSEGEYSAPRYFFDRDPVHFLPSTGAKIINSVVGEEIQRDPELKRWSSATPPSSKVPLEPIPVQKIIYSDGGANFHPENAFDNDETTAWVSPETGAGMKGKSWIGAMFDMPQTVEGIRLVQTPNPPYRQAMVLVQESQDGTKWTSVGARPFCAYDEVTNIVIPPAPPARAWRIVAASDVVPGTTNRWSVYELTFLGHPAGP